MTTLLKLPADVQAAIDIDALSQTYYDYLTAGKKGKTAAQTKAVEALFTSAEAAIASASWMQRQCRSCRSCWRRLTARGAWGIMGRSNQGLF